MTTLPPHIQNAETPRTDAQEWTETNRSNSIVSASFSRQLERENIYLREVLEKVHRGCSCQWSNRDESGEILWGGQRLIHKCSSCEAYEQLKKDLVI